MRDFLTPPGYEGARWSARKLLNVYLSRWEEGRGRTKLRSYPFKLTVEATGACNLRCPACFTGVGDVGRPGSAMPLDLYRRVLRARRLPLRARVLQLGRAAPRQEHLHDDRRGERARHLHHGEHELQLSF